MKEHLLPCRLLCSILLLSALAGKTIAYYTPNGTLPQEEDLHQPPKNFRQFYTPSTDLKRLLDLPVDKKKAPVLLNFIPTYKSALPDVPRKKKKKSLSLPSATTTQAASTSRPDQLPTSDPISQPSTSTPFLVPIPERKRRRRLVLTAQMGRAKPVAKDFLSVLPTDVDAQPAQTIPPPKPKRIKKAQPKAKAAQVDSEDTLPISKLAPSEKAASVPTKRSAETLPSESTKSKRPRSSATTSGSKKPDVPWAPEITIEDKPVMSSDSADDINVGVALSTALLLPGDLERNAEFSEYENYALMLQHSVQAIQHAHSFSMQSFENREKLIEQKREISALQKSNKSLQSKMKTLEDQAEVAIKEKDEAEEKVGAAEAVNKVLQAQLKEAEDKLAQAQKELQDALATKAAEIKDDDEKAYAQDMADVTDAYEQQVKQACNRGVSLGWMSLCKKLNVPEDSPLRKADAIPLPFPAPPQSEVESKSEAEDEGNNDDEALMRKSKDAAEAKSPPPTEQVMDLTLDEEGDEVVGVSKEAVIGHLSSDLLLAEKSLDKTLAEIDAELASEKAAEAVSQETSEVQTQTAPEAQE